MEQPWDRPWGAFARSKWRLMKALPSRLRSSRSPRRRSCLMKQISPRGHHGSPVQYSSQLLKASESVPRRARVGARAVAELHVAASPCWCACAGHLAEFLQISSIQFLRFSRAADSITYASGWQAVVQHADAFIRRGTQSW